MTVTGARHVAHTRVSLLTPRRLLYHTELIVPQPWALPFRVQHFSGPSRAQRGLAAPGVANAEWQADTDQSCSWKPCCHRWEGGQRVDDKCGDKSSMPGLDQGQGSRIRQHGWTLLVSSQTIHSPQWTSAIARLSHLSLESDGPEPSLTRVLHGAGGDAWLMGAESRCYTFVYCHLLTFSKYRQRLMPARSICHSRHAN